MINVIRFAKIHFLWQAIAVNRLVSVLAMGLLGAACGCVERGSGGASAGPLLQFHFAGVTNITGTNAAKLQAVLALPVTAELRNEAFAKLARTPQVLWKKSLPAGLADQSALLRPLLDDLATSESYVELRSSAERPGVLIAAQIDSSRAVLWSTNLWQAATNWKLGTPAVQGTNGWRAGNDLDLAFGRSGKWTVAALSHEKDAIQRFNAPAFQPFKTSAAPIVLDLKADLPRLAGIFPVLGKFKLPPVELKVTGSGEYVRTEGKLLYSDRLPIKLEPWKIPTNIVIDPLISFTCGQGIAPVLPQIKGYEQLGIKEKPNQFSLWGMATVHAQTFLTVPMSDPTNVMKQIAPRLPGFVSANITNLLGNFLWVSNRAEWIWHGLPMVLPHVHPEKLPAGEFLYAGLFPMGPRTNTAPGELFAQVIGRTNLVYYDWELTQERLPHARHTFQLLDIIQQRRLPSAKIASQRWLTNIVAHLGNSITEVTQTSPKELSLVRKSHVGLTGFELVLLTRWLDSPGFPMTYDPPPFLSVRTNRPPALATNQLPRVSTNLLRGPTNTLPAKATNQPAGTRAK